jgi:hypothetical protein
MMLKILTVCLLFFIVFLLQSCGPAMYGVGKIGSENSYLEKPMHYDTIRNNSAIYISTRGNITIQNVAYQKRDNLYYGEAILHRSHTFKHAQCSYGIFGYVGVYYIDSVGPYNGNRDFYGGGMTFHFNIVEAFNNAEWRYIGLRFTGLNEQGSYASFRDLAHQQYFIQNLHPKNTAFNLSLTSEFIFKVGKVDIGYYYAFGNTFGSQNRNIITSSGTLHASSGLMTAFIQLNNTENTWSPFTGDGTESVRTLSVGFSYRIRNRFNR